MYTMPYQCFRTAADVPMYHVKPPRIFFIMKIVNFLFTFSIQLEQRLLEVLVSYLMPIENTENAISCRPSSMTH